jgi:YNFM family putative membrane transporter
MTQATSTMEIARMEMSERSSGVLLRSAVICLTAFLTVVDLFATQAILPSLTRAYHVTPAAMGAEQRDDQSSDRHANGARIHGRRGI